MAFWIRNTPDNWTLTRDGETLATLQRRRGRWTWRVGITPSDGMAGSGLAGSGLAGSGLAGSGSGAQRRGRLSLRGIAGSLEDAIRLVSVARTGLPVGYLQPGPSAA